MRSQDGEAPLCWPHDDLAGGGVSQRVGLLCFSEIKSFGPGGIDVYVLHFSYKEQEEKKKRFVARIFVDTKKYAGPGLDSGELYSMKWESTTHTIPGGRLSKGSRKSTFSTARARRAANAFRFFLQATFGSGYGLFSFAIQHSTLI